MQQSTTGNIRKIINNKNKENDKHGICFLTTQSVEPEPY